jgi:tetratricopeptide (TPR) repeat protein
MPSLLPQALQLAAQSLQKGELQQAEQLCRQILAKDANQSEALYLLSAVAAKVNRYDDAINLLKHAIEIKYESRYYDTLGILLFKTKQYAEAFNFFQKATEIEPNSEQTKINLKKVSQIRLLRYHVPITRIKISSCKKIF